MRIGPVTIVTGKYFLLPLGRSRDWSAWSLWHAEATRPRIWIPFDDGIDVCDLIHPQYFAAFVVRLHPNPQITGYRRCNTIEIENLELHCQARFDKDAAAAGRTRSRAGNDREVKVIRIVFGNC